MRQLTAVTAAAAIMSSAAVAAAAPASADDDPQVLHVAMTGSDANPGTADRPLRSVVAAASKVTPGTTVKIHAGYYAGQVKIRANGTPSAPITFTTAGDGPVMVDSSQTPVRCDSSQPAVQRTFMISGDYVTIDGLDINNGVTVSGIGNNSAYSWHADLVKREIWEPRRAIAGRSSDDPAAARAMLVGDLRRVTGNAKIDPADGVVVKNSTITSRGIHGTLARYGTFRNNDIHDIACGTGPGIWLMTFSDGNMVSSNDISRVSASGYKHYMQEGIRFGTSSNYNTIEDNYVHDLGQGDARGMTTDVDSSFNTFRDNLAVGVAAAFNEQMAGWGNTWRGNYAAGYRTYAFGIRLMDNQYTHPRMTSASRGGLWVCNIATAPATAGAKALGIGGIANGTFQRNLFDSTWLASTVKSYWTAEGNTWNGSPLPPDRYPSTAGACGAAVDRFDGAAKRGLLELAAGGA